MGLTQVEIDNDPEVIGSRRLPRVITMAGSDPSGGAGIEADLKTLLAVGCYGMTCIDGITVQNTLGVTGKDLTSFETIRMLMDANFNDAEPIEAIKVGMMTENVVRWFKECWDIFCTTTETSAAPFVVVDPIISSSSGYSLAKQQLVKSAARYVYSHATLLTPNLLEARAIMQILGLPAPENYRELAKAVCDAVHCRAVLLKAGHMPDNEDGMLYDLLYDSDAEGTYTTFRHPRIDGAKNTHGTGCTLSSAIAGYLARGYPLETAVAFGTSYLHTAIVHADPSLGKGHGPLNHFYGK